jgi:hypothetical protein
MLERLGNPPFLVLNLGGVAMEHVFVRGEGYELMLASAESLLQDTPRENRFAVAMLRVACALANAVLGRREESRRWRVDVVRAIERAPGWSVNYTFLAGMAARSAWEADDAEDVERIETNLRQKTVGPDFRAAHCDARLALAHCAALKRRWDEALQWFAQARQVLDEQGARPLRTSRGRGRCAPSPTSTRR